MALSDKLARLQANLASQQAPLPSSAHINKLASAQESSVASSSSSGEEHGLALSDVCGIIAFVSTSEAATPYLLEGLTILQNRGYDSAGICTIHSEGESSELVCTKFASASSTSDSIELLKANADRHGADRIGIAHTRWATHGGKTAVNSHPHFDVKKRIAVVHNGVIENYAELKKELTELGVIFASQTDTEVIAQLIGKFMDDGFKLEEAVSKALAKLEGTWGLAILSSDHPDQIIASRNGSPLLVGISQGRMFVASEGSAFSRHTKQVISLENGETAIVRADEHHNLDLRRIEMCESDEIELSPAPYPHWTLKEINDQVDAVSRSLNMGGRIANPSRVKLGGLEKDREALLAIRHLVIAACGTSMHAGLYAATVMRSLNSFDTIEVVDASELLREHFPRKHAGLLVISQSGETKDVHRCLTIAQEIGVHCFSVVNSVGSLIARSTKCGVYTNAGREHAVASTKAFTTQVVCLCLIACWFSQNRDLQLAGRQVLIDSLQRLPMSVASALKLGPEIAPIAAALTQAEHMFILGKGPCEAIAREAALKIKEITYIHAEGFPAGSLKHGPFALITPGTPIILLMPDDATATSMRSAAHEVRARGAITIGVTNKPKICEDVCDHIIHLKNVTSSYFLAPLLTVIPMQMLAYELAIARGIDPDKPRNLAKAVTVL